MNLRLVHRTILAKHGRDGARGKLGGDLLTRFQSRNPVARLTFRESHFRICAEDRQSLVLCHSTYDRKAKKHRIHRSALTGMDRR